MKNRHSFRRRGRQQMIPVLVDGNPQVIPAGAIAQDSWKPAHGKTLGGVQVNSPKFATFGGSTLIQSDDGHVFSLPTADAEMAAVALARQFGYTVTAPKAHKAK